MPNVKAGARVAICGSGFAGSIVAYCLQKLPDVEVTIFERAPDYKTADTAAALNLNPNAISCLRGLLPELCAKLTAAGFPRESIRAVNLQGEELFSIPFLLNGEKNLADGHGCRVAWAMAMATMRSEVKNIQYRTEVKNYSTIGDETFVTFRDLNTGQYYESSFDLVIAADGRYSQLREQCTGKPVPYMNGVSNFRILLPDTSKGLHQDLLLMYNNSADPSLLPQSFQTADVKYAFSAPPRLAAQRVNFFGKSFIYVFGNIAVKGEIPTLVKDPKVLRLLFTPTAGKISKQCKWIVDRVCARASELHWARFQGTDSCFRSEDGRILFVGDSGQAFCPSLGQGAGAAIESACTVGIELARAIGAAKREALASTDYKPGLYGIHMREATKTIARLLEARIANISLASDESAKHNGPVSLTAGPHVNFAREMSNWKNQDDAGHNSIYHELWNGYYRHPNFDTVIEEEFQIEKNHDLEDEDDEFEDPTVYKLQVTKSVFALPARL